MTVYIQNKITGQPTVIDAQALMAHLLVEQTRLNVEIYRAKYLVTTDEKSLTAFILLLKEYGAALEHARPYVNSISIALEGYGLN